MHLHGITKMIVFFFLSFPAIINAQNLIPNGDFESYTECPTDYGQVSNLDNWHSAAQSPDFFHVCAGEFAPGVPWSQEFGFQESHSGSSHCGLYTYGIEDYREYVQVGFEEPVQAGDLIRFSFYLSRASGGNNTNFDCASNNFGFLLTNDVFSEAEPLMITNEPTWYIDEVITDTSGWSFYSGEFVCDSEYTSIVFGNLFNNENTAIVDYTENFNCRAYYYMDDVCFSKNDLCLFTSVSTVSPDNPKLYPSFFTENLHLNLGNSDTYNEIRLVDYIGRTVLHEQINSSITVLNTTGLAAGYYVAILSGSNSIYFLNIIKI